MVLQKRKHVMEDISTNETSSKALILKDLKRKKESNDGLKSIKVVQNSLGNRKAGEPDGNDWHKFKQVKKELKLKRKKAKDSYFISLEAKRLYKELNCRKTKEKHGLVENLFKLLERSDSVDKFAMAHDTARIIQCMLKYASPLMRDNISERLLPYSVKMCTSKYSYFCVLRMLKYGSINIKNKLTDSFFGNILKLSSHNMSNKILDYIYISVANTQQQIYMQQEFYGELYRNSKDNNVKCLQDTYKKTPDMKSSILGSVKLNLERIVNKQLLDNSLVHAVLLEYLKNIEEDQIEETIVPLLHLTPLMLTTKDGCQAAIICFYKSSSKHRRAILKSIKEHLLNICTHEHGHVFILVVLNSLDDTKAIKKTIYDSLDPKLMDIVSNQWGRRVMQWLISPADTNFFHPTFISYIEEGLKYSKKDKKVRQVEIFEQIEEHISKAIVDQPKFWISDRHISLVTAEFLKKINTNHFITVANSLAEVIANPEWSVTITTEINNTVFGNKVSETPKNDVKKKPANSVIPGIEDVGLHMILKKVIKNDGSRLVHGLDAETFGSILVNHLSNKTLNSWVTINRACFVLIHILENNNDTVNRKLKEALSVHQQTLKQQSSSGAQLLMKKLNLT